MKPKSVLIAGTLIALAMGLAFVDLDSGARIMVFGTFPPLAGGLAWRLSGVPFWVAASWSVPLAAVVLTAPALLPIPVAEGVMVVGWIASAAMTFLPSVGRFWMRTVLRLADDVILRVDPWKQGR
jgi:hypothetical protein